MRSFSIIKWVNSVIFCSLIKIYTRFLPDDVTEQVYLGLWMCSDPVGPRKAETRWMSIFFCNILGLRRGLCVAYRGNTHVLLMKLCLELFRVFLTHKMPSRTAIFTLHKFYTMKKWYHCLTACEKMVPKHHVFHTYISQPHSYNAVLTPLRRYRRCYCVLEIHSISWLLQI